MNSTASQNLTLKLVKRKIPYLKRAKLNSLADVKSEIAKLYREARNNKVDIQDASRLVNILSILARLIEGSDLEKRILKLEGNLDD